VVTAWELESGVAATAATAAKRRTTSNVFRIYSVLPKNTKNCSSGRDAWDAEKSPLGARGSRFGNCVSISIPSLWSRGIAFRMDFAQLDWIRGLLTL
jgi:hypothetical protein